MFVDELHGSVGLLHQSINIIILSLPPVEHSHVVMDYLLRQ